MTRHIGIVATSGDGPVLCYQTICEEGSELLGRYRHPVVTMQTIPLADYLRHANAGQWQEVGELLLSSAEALARAGAELLVCPVNTLHNGIDLVRERAPLPWLHIAEEVANVAVERGYRRLLVLGEGGLPEGAHPPSSEEAKRWEKRFRIAGPVLVEVPAGDGTSSLWLGFPLDDPPRGRLWAELRVEWLWRPAARPA